MSTDRSRRRALGAIGTMTFAAPLALGRAVEQTRWDLIFVGAGTAGLPAAVFAAARGLRVIVLEITSSGPGTLAPPRTS